MRLITLIRDLFNTRLSSFEARRRLLAQSFEDAERTRRHESIRKDIWEYKNSPAALLELDSSDELKEEQ